MVEEGRALHKNWLEKDNLAPGQRRKTKQSILFLRWGKLHQVAKVIEI